MALITALIVVGTVARIAPAQSITLNARDAEVWLHEQVVSGDVTGDVETGTLFVGADPYRFDVADDHFAVDVQLNEGLNEIVACGSETCSDTLRWTLGYDLRPEVYASVTVNGRSVELHGQILEEPNGPAIAFSWQQDTSNPATVTLSGATDSVATVAIPNGAPPGEYYFEFAARDAGGSEGRSRTFVTVDSASVTAFDIQSDHAAWIDRAIVYEVTPYIFHRNGTWRDVTGRLDEIAALGVNTLWIQPVFKAQLEGPSTSGQGYGITDYFELRPDLGTPEDLRELVRRAKEDFGMRVLFDFVPNHTSIEHPYAEDVLEHGASSHYYPFYLTEKDQAPYSQFYTRSRRGPFLYYFWDKLVIIDWSNPEVYRWMMEAGRKWIEELDIDGYRIDAVWGVNARTPEAMQQWRFDLKRMKPDIFLLGEDKATWPSSFENRFDAAYDWFPEEGWVSHWTWQTDFSATENRTIFNNTSESERSARLRDALTNRGDGWHQDAKVFRFVQNNDTEPFIESHGPERTKMATSLLFALPGIPMIYNGQEIGHDRHPYETSQIFDQAETIPEQDPYGFYEHHRDLIALRKTFPVFYSDTLEELNVEPDNISGHTFAFRRWSGDEHMIAVVNMGENSVRARLSLPTNSMGLSETETYYLTDLFTGESGTLSGGRLRFPVVSLPGYSTRLFMLGDEAVQVPTRSEAPERELPAHISLHQNYPNPFNPSTTIVFDTPSSKYVSLRVFDVLGRQVATLMDGMVGAGRHEVRFDARRLPSGVYVYRIDAGNRTLTKTMLLTK